MGLRKPLHCPKLGEIDALFWMLFFRKLTLPRVEIQGIEVWESQLGIIPHFLSQIPTSWNKVLWADSFVLELISFYLID